MRSESSWEQRAEVRALASSGHSVRAIAERVFGDRRLKGRVERILARSATTIERLEAEAAALAIERGRSVVDVLADDAGDDDLAELIASLETDLPPLDA